jgi:hypothetical protein
MSAKFTLKGNVSGKFFLAGSGFSATCAKLATQLTADEAAGVQQCARNFGSETSTQEAVSTGSFAVVYVRKNDKFEGGALVKAKLDSGANQFDPSKRRFATRAEANTHGKRFDTRRARKSDPVGSGTAGHIGFFVIPTNDAATDYVNPLTGLTNKL